jgi:hypothetical protein
LLSYRGAAAGFTNFAASIGRVVALGDTQWLPTPIVVPVKSPASAA